MRERAPKKSEVIVFTQLYLTGEVHYSPIGDMKRPLPTVLPSTWKCWRKWVRCTFLTPPDVLDEENLANLLDTANREQRKLTIRRWSWWTSVRWNASTASCSCEQTDFLADLRLRSTGPGVAEASHRAATALPTLAEFTRTYLNK